MNTNSNTYTIIYASVMVIIVAFLLAFVSGALKETQDENVRLDKKKQIAEIKSQLSKTIKPSEKLKTYLESIGEKNAVQGTTIENLIKRPAVSLVDASNALGILTEYSQSALRAVEVNTKYSGYIERQYLQVSQESKLEEKKIPEDFDYLSLAGLRLEAREKLAKIKPLTVGMASRISGVNPADITVLLM